MTKVIPFQAAFQASRYARMGHGDLFTQAGSIEAGETVATTCGLVSGDESQEFLLDTELPAGSDRSDVERILRQLSRDLRDGVLMIVSPDSAQRAQIKLDGIQLHQARLDVLLAALDHTAHHHTLSDGSGIGFNAGFMAYQLRQGFSVVIKTN